MLSAIHAFSSPDERRISMEPRKNASRHFGRFILLPFVALLWAGCAQTEMSGPPRWVGTWATSVQLTEPRNLPPEPGLANNTLRQVVRVSIGGERLRLKFSNMFGDEPVVIEAAHLALSEGNGAIDTASDHALSFGGATGITIAPGTDVMSDPIDFSVDPRTDLAVTTKFGAMSNTVITGHPGSRTTSYIQEGDAVSAPALGGAPHTDHWYIITEIDVVDAYGRAVVTLGDSITDGRGSTTNQQNRWPDVLAERLLGNESTSDIAVLNAGIGGNCVLRPCLGPAALDRFDRDVINQDNVRWVIILEGVNDIGGSRPDSSASVAEHLISAFQDLIDRAHAHDIEVFGATIMPFGASFYDSPQHEAARQTVNEWIRTSGAFDAVVDLDAATRDPDNPARLLPVADDGDHLHPSVEGHRMMAEAVDLSLFTGN
jgi:lysophospholipase L1-like esterase